MTAIIINVTETHFLPNF